MLTYLFNWATRVRSNEAREMAPPATEQLCWAVIYCGVEDLYSLLGFISRSQFIPSDLEFSFIISLHLCAFWNSATLKMPPIGCKEILLQTYIETIRIVDIV